MSANVQQKTIALVGNPNVGKSTVFNTLTGNRQHTGNWPGKTVEVAQGTYAYKGKSYRLIDLPGTYSLISRSEEEEVTAQYLLSGESDCVVFLADATCLSRSLILVLQALETTQNAVLCVNLMDEAERNGIDVDLRRLEEELGILPEEIDFIFSETSYPPSEKEDVCDIIDIANEEMKKIDSTQIDSEFKKTFTIESTENLFYLINSGEWTEEDLKTYVDMLDSDGVLELRISDGYLFAKTVISKKELSEVMKIDEGLIKNVPVNGKYNFYIINTLLLF